MITPSPPTGSILTYDASQGCMAWAPMPTPPVYHCDYCASLSESPTNCRSCGAPLTKP